MLRCAWTRKCLCVIILCVVALILYILKSISVCHVCVRGCFHRPDLLPGHVHVSGHTVFVLLIACTVEKLVAIITS